MIFGCLPFNSEDSIVNHTDIYNQITLPAIKNLIDRMLNKDLSQRCKFDDLKADIDKCLRELNF